MGRMDTAKLVLDGVRDADARYYDMSGGVGINDNGVETFVSAMIAQKIYRNKKQIGKDIWISLEEKFSMLLEYSGADARGGLANDYSKYKRVDVAVYRNEKLYFIIEVKRDVNFSTISHDVARIDYLLNRMGRKSGSLKFGLMTGIAQSLKDKKPLKDRMADTVSKIKDNFPNLKVTSVPTNVIKSDRFDTNLGAEVEGSMPYCFLLEAK